MTEIDSVNTCLATISDPFDQTNCIATAVGYPRVAATSSSTTCSDIDQIELPVLGCRNKYYVAAGALGVAGLITLVLLRK